MFKLSYRPDTYWPESLNSEQLLSRIKGKVRQDLARKAFREEGFLGLTEFIAKQELTDAERDGWGGIHPRMMGGEYLPDARVGEVEIARLSLQSVTFDQISVRARPAGRGIDYVVVDEYESAFNLPFDRSIRPLSLGGLIRFLDGIEHEGLETFDDYPGGLVRCHWSVVEYGGTPEEAAAFVSIESAFYPELTTYYEQEAEAWVDGYLAKWSDPDDELDEAPDVALPIDQRCDIARPGLPCPDAARFACPRCRKILWLEEDAEGVSCWECDSPVWRIHE